MFLYGLGFGFALGTIPSISPKPPLYARLPERGGFSLLLLAVSRSLYVWTVSPADADRATHSPMGSLCPVLTLFPEPSAVAKEKGAVGML